MSLCAVQDWGLEFNMALLLIAAFYSTNLFSLVYLAIIAVGMAAPVSARCLTWRFWVLPLLAVVVVEQYSLYIGPPPPWDQSQSEALGRHHDDTPQSPIRVSSWIPYGRPATVFCQVSASERAALLLHSLALLTSEVQDCQALLVA